MVDFRSRIAVTHAGAAAVMALLVGYGIPARAAEDGGITQVVTAADLNLGGPAGRAVLRHRLAVAALQVCGAAGNTGDALSQCRQGALRGAWREADAMMARSQGGAAFAALATGDGRPH
jgi:UrcA family protein